MADEPETSDEWLRHARGYSSDDGGRHFLLYLLVFQRWGTPADFEAVAQRAGDAKRLLEKMDLLDERMETWAWNRRFWRNVGWVVRMAGGAGAVFGMILAARGVWVWLTGG